MAYEQIEQNMTNHPPINSNVERTFESIRTYFKDVAMTIEDMCPDSREKSLAMTNLEQSLMWAIASVARNQQQTLTQLGIDDGQE